MMVDSQNVCPPTSITPDVLEAASILVMMKKGLRLLLLEARQTRGHFPYVDFTALPPGSAPFHYFLNRRLAFGSSLYDNITPMPAAYHFALPHAQSCSLPQPVAYYGMLTTPPCFVGPPRDNMLSSTATPEVENEISLQPVVKKPRLSSTSASSPEIATPEKPESRRKRKNLTKEQLQILEGVYAEEKYPHIEERLKLEKPTRLTEDRIQVWFQNRRAKDRKKFEAEKLQCYFEKSQKTVKEQEECMSNGKENISIAESQDDAQSPPRKKNNIDNR